MSFGSDESTQEYPISERTLNRSRSPRRNHEQPPSMGTSANGFAWGKAGPHPNVAKGLGKERQQQPQRQEGPQQVHEVDTLSFGGEEAVPVAREYPWTCHWDYRYGVWLGDPHWDSARSSGM